jgi:hypothetical protein
MQADGISFRHRGGHPVPTILTGWPEVFRFRGVVSGRGPSLPGQDWLYRDSIS